MKFYVNNEPVFISMNIKYYSFTTDHRPPMHCETVPSVHCCFSNRLCGPHYTKEIMAAPPLFSFSHSCSAFLQQLLSCWLQIYNCYQIGSKLFFTLFAIFNKAISTFAGFRLHSQMVIIFQPSFFNAFKALVSLAMLPFILLSHQSVLVLGTTKYLQSLCPCQKQPLTKITVLYFGKTISGLPGRLLS